MTYDSKEINETNDGRTINWKVILTVHKYISIHIMKIILVTP